MHERESLFLVFGLILLLLPARFFLLVLRRRLLLATQLRVLVRIAIIVIIVFLISLEVLILALVFVSSVHNFGLLLLLHYDLHLTGLEIFDQSIKLSPFHTQKLDHFFLLPQRELNVELLVAGIDAVELDGLYVLNPEIQDGFRNENKGIFEHVQPSCLSLHVCLNTGLSRLRFKVISWLNQVDSRSGIQQLDQNLELGARILRFQFAQLRVILKRLRRDLSLEIDLNILLDLYHDIPVDSLPLIDGLVLVELQHYRDLAFISHRQDEPSRDVLVLDSVVEGHTVESDAFLVEIDSVLPAGDCQINVQKGGQ